MRPGSRPASRLPFFLLAAVILAVATAALAAARARASPARPNAADLAEHAPRRAEGGAPPAPRAGPSAADLERLAARERGVVRWVSIDPRTPPDAGADAGEKRYTPRLTGRGPDGREVLAFPLVHTRVAAQVSGNVARVEVTQFYRNPSQGRLEAIYAFPLPPNAAVTDMLFRVGSRVVLSEVKRRGEARRTYEAARREGRTAALTEAERPNLFTQSVANVPPGETVAVVLRYVHEVPFDAGRYRFHFPTTVGPRYVPGAPREPPHQGAGSSPDTDRVPDASRVTPPVLPPGTRAGHDVDILVRLVPGDAFGDVASASHRILTGVDGAGGARLVALAEDDRIPDKDFVLSWAPAGASVSPHALVEREKGERFLMLFVQPPADVPAALVRPKEVVFLLDKSGSMSGGPIERAKSLVARALDAMGPDDTFQIVAFDGASAAMSPAPLPAISSEIARAKRWMGSLSGGGGTEMMEGILAALTPPADPRRLRMVVFCTDGFIGNEAEIIEAVERLRGPARVFGFGIGSSVNRYLIEGVAKAGRGASEVVLLDEEPTPAVARLFKRLDRPVLTELELELEGGAVSELLPARLPDLFAGQPLVVAGKVRDAAPTAVILRGRLGEGPYEARVPIAIREGTADSAQPVLGTLWARRRVDDLLPERPGGDAPAAVEEAVALALRFKLVTKHTSLVAVERTLLVDPSLPLARALVPNELPAGTSFEGIFGPASVEVLPARVKPGDPELRVDAPGAVAVRVRLPWEPAPREALRDPVAGDHVLRFLVPPAWPDGSWAAKVEILRADGSVEERLAPVRVDTTPAAVAVVSAPATARPGEEVRLALKPALPLGTLPGLAGRPGGLGNALKGAMEVKEILVRAPWGEIDRARMEGPLGAYVAVLSVPADARPGPVELEVVASDAAGNVARRKVALAVTAAGGAPRVEASLAGTLALAAVAGALLAGVTAVADRRRRRRIQGRTSAVGFAPALAPASLRRSRRGEAIPPAAPLRTVARRGRFRLGVVLVALLGLAALAAAALVLRERARLRHLAVPTVTDPSIARADAAPIVDLPACASEGLGRVGRRVTAILAVGEGSLLAGTFDAGVWVVERGEARALEGLEGRELFVNALAAHDGLAWAATAGGLVALDGERRALSLLRGEPVTGLARAGSHLYAATARDVYRVSAERGAEPLGVTGPDGEPVRATAMAAAGARLWIGTASGVYALPRASLDAPLLSRTAAWHPLVFGHPGAETNVVTALAAAEAGVLVGTDDGGVVWLSGDGAVTAARFADPRANEVNPGAAAAAAAGLVVGTQGGGVLVATARGSTLEVGRAAGQAGRSVSAVAPDGETILVGDDAGALARLVCEPARS
jgi:Ca-activated chloride channel family protein